VAFAVPPNVTGGPTIVVDAVPVPMTAIHKGDIVGSIQVSPSVSASELRLPGTPERTP